MNVIGCFDHADSSGGKSGDFRKKNFLGIGGIHFALVAGNPEIRISTPQNSLTAFSSGVTFVLYSDGEVIRVQPHYVIAILALLEQQAVWNHVESGDFTLLHHVALESEHTSGAEVLTVRGDSQSLAGGPERRRASVVWLRRSIETECKVVLEDIVMEKGHLFIRRNLNAVVVRNHILIFAFKRRVFGLEVMGLLRGKIGEPIDKLIGLVNCTIEERKRYDEISRSLEDALHAFEIVSGLVGVGGRNVGVPLARFVFPEVETNEFSSLIRKVIFRSGSDVWIELGDQIHVCFTGFAAEVGFLTDDVVHSLVLQTLITGVFLNFEHFTVIKVDIVVAHVLENLTVVRNELIFRNAELGLTEVDWVVGIKALLAGVVIHQHLLLGVNVQNALQLCSTLLVALSYDVVIGLDA